ncbi:MAG: PTS sugar transporter subunit IIA [Atopobium sp.]|uniref:PTS sugar transporter subunit IIA n=1 Tax=Atopobium sp. TaxID=1872650 RepID=UPI002A75F7F3|nr:PTS sugar transporter subunit IIA [Atopobium sp.]MDY2788513.1 PTS sugar transporter subunit IIA [Atopobium sp.]
MIGFIITGHGDFATGLYSAFTMIAGPQDGVVAVTFQEDEAASFGNKLADAIKDLRTATDGVAVFCDLIGGTPFNQAMMAAQSMDNVEVVAGVNLPMLLECGMERALSTSAHEICVNAVAADALGIAHMSIDVVEQDDDSDTELDEEEGI